MATAVQAADIELHEYQLEFLDSNSAGQPISQAIDGLVVQHAENYARWGEIYRTVHCHRCDTADGLKENAWRKSLHPVTLNLPASSWSFLEDRVANVEGVALEEAGPVNRALKSLDKAVRASIDYVVSLAEQGEDVAPLFASPMPVDLEMHDYQEEFLADKAQRHGLRDRAAPLRCLLNYAAANPDQWDAMFRTVHCHRCDTEDGLKENEWKKSKKPVSLSLRSAHVEFLEHRVANVEGVEIEDTGPVNRALKDTAKAVRAVIDWAIEEEDSGVSVAHIFGGFAESGADADEVTAALAGIPPLEACLNTFDYELVAQKLMPLVGKQNGWDYFASGADDEETLRNNANAFHKIWMEPRVLRNVESIDMSCDIVGNTCPFPLYLSSVAMQKLGHDDGELAWIRAANNTGLIHMLPTMSSISADDCFAECNALDQPFWYQLYVHPDREIAKEMILKAQNAGCSVLFVTCDTPTLGRRDRDRRNKVGAASSSAGSGAIGTGSPKDSSLNWEDIPWFRSVTTMKLFLKGIGTGEDAVSAFEAGVDGIVCSNHGGRQLNTARSGIEILAEVTEALESRFSAEERANFTVLMDGGVRRGTDIFKALALGATAVGLGKPVSFAMSAYGQPGIEQMLGQLMAEFRNTMQLMGCNTVQQIRDEGRHMINTKNLHTHLDTNPSDSHYEPVNVFTHGKLHPLLDPGAGQGQAMVTETVTETVQHPDGRIITTSTTEMRPATALSRL
eukprot:COSAG02_NODE_1075_length_14754_cov_18.686796_5_plen_734_part_00